MDINIWQWLSNEDDSRLLLKQRIPEVVVFRGCHLEGWYHCIGGGLVARRQDGGSVLALLERLLVLSAEELGVGLPLAEEAPAAILRRSSGSGSLDQGFPAQVTIATLLTARELSELLRRVADDQEAGDPEATIAGGSVWSLQSFKLPLCNLRILSVYSCDAHLQERSDIFARQFHLSYPTLGERAPNVVPSLEETAATADDVKPVDITAAQRRTVEAKTLGIVRFARRFHNLDLEGISLEFVFDQDGRAVLHGCTCLSLINEQDIRKFRVRCPDWSAAAATRFERKPPAAFSVPAVEPSADVGPTDATWAGVSSAKQAFSWPAEAEASTQPQPSPDADEDQTDEPPPTEDTYSKHEQQQQQQSQQQRQQQQQQQQHEEQRTESTLLLEIWRGEAFLGEAQVPFPRKSSTAQELRMLRLHPGGLRPPIHPDSRKLRAEPAECSPGTVIVSLGWAVPSTPSSNSSSTKEEPLLHFNLGRAEGLPQVMPSSVSSPKSPGSPFAQEPGIRALLWLRRPGSTDCIPVWASRQAEEVEESQEGRWVSIAVWGEEHVEVSVPQVSQMPPPSRPPVTPGTPPSPARPPPPEPAKIRSVFDHVCGAELGSHWGMFDGDGTMRAHVLSSQVLQRLGLGRMNRSGLLKQLAQDIGRFHDLQQAWRAQLEEARDKDREIEKQMKEQEALLLEKSHELDVLTQEHARRMASSCRSFSGEADEFKAREYADTNLLNESRHRSAQQRAKVAKNSERQLQLQGSLDRSATKLEELVSQRAKAKQVLDATRSANWYPNESLSATRARDRGIKLELGAETEELAKLNGSLATVAATNTKERNHILELEDYIRRVATQPTVALRTGGGYLLDNTAKHDAQALVRELRL